MLVRAQTVRENTPVNANHPEWLDWPSEKITRNLNEYAEKHDTTLDPALAEAQTRVLLENCEWE